MAKDVKKIKDEQLEELQGKLKMIDGIRLQVGSLENQKFGFKKSHKFRECLLSLAQKSGLASRDLGLFLSARGLEERKGGPAGQLLPETRQLSHFSRLFGDYVRLVNLGCSFERLRLEGEGVCFSACLPASS